jgi:predicted enzyme related to lactoylglutathione lyase
VDDCDAAVAKAQALGGAVTMPARDFPGVGRIALLKDPQGAHFYVIRLTGPLGH